jgi:glycyl-radical enzyme activating protein
MKRKSLVFDIQRASLHDGPGIRTTVFLKGCPLHCLWCHNPEAASFERQLFFYYDKCRYCGDCERVCTRSVHHVENDRHTIDYAHCDFCGDCIAACSQRALKIVGAEMSVDEVMREVLADSDFYEVTGGGMTLSGGEPLAHLEFSLELLKACRQAGIGTCIETSGYASLEKVKKVFPLVDVWLFDYKITGSAQHQQFTGVSNERILSNLDWVYRSEASIILRCPIIPGVNDTQAHFEGIRALDLKYPGLKMIEILPYHDMGNSKRISLGKELTLPDVRTAVPTAKDDWLSLLKSLGCEKAR